MRIPKRSEIKEYTDTQIERLQDYLRREIAQRIQDRKGQNLARARVEKLMQDSNLTAKEVARILRDNALAARAEKRKALAAKGVTLRG